MTEILAKTTIENGSQIEIILELLVKSKVEKLVTPIQHKSFPKTCGMWKNYDAKELRRKVWE
jgi:hypothetical protein